MIDLSAAGTEGHGGSDAVALTVGCRFGVQATLASTAIMQVAPCLQPGIAIRSERWETSADHHGYLDSFGNRCERFELEAGAAHVEYEAQVVLADAADLVEPGAGEIPVGTLPDGVLSFVMPSRFCLPGRARPRGMAALRPSRPGLESRAGDRRLRP